MQGQAFAWGDFEVELAQRHTAVGKVVGHLVNGNVPFNPGAGAVQCLLSGVVDRY